MLVVLMLEVGQGQYLFPFTIVRPHAENLTSYAFDLHSFTGGCLLSTMYLMFLFLLTFFGSTLLK